MTNAVCLGAQHSAQLARERRMTDLGRQRAERQIAKALDRGEAMETPAGTALARRVIGPLVAAIETVNRRAILTRDRRPILTRGGARLSGADQCRFNALPLAALLS